MRYFIYALAVALLAGPKLHAQCTSAQVPLATTGLTGCTVSCSCKFRVTMTESDNGSLNQTPSVPSIPLMGPFHRFQNAKGGRPYSDVRVASFFSMFSGLGFGTSLIGQTSLGWRRIQIDHIDVCAHCASNCVWSGWSMPQTTLTASIKGNSSYLITAQLQAEFTLLHGASNQLLLVESGSQQSYIGAIGGGFGLTPTGPSVSGGFLVNWTNLANTQPTGRIYLSPWKGDQKTGLQETIYLLGEVTTQATADRPNALSTNEAEILLKGSRHCVGVRFRCICSPGSHSNPTGSPGSTPPTPGPGGGGTTPGGGPGGTTPDTTGPNGPLRPNSPQGTSETGGSVLSDSNLAAGGSAPGEPASAEVTAFTTWILAHWMAFLDVLTHK